MIDYNGEKILCLCEGTFEKDLIVFGVWLSLIILNFRTLNIH